MAGVLWAAREDVVSPTAHVMVWAEHGMWESVCSYNLRRPYGGMHYTGSADEPDRPPYPWCHRCLGIAERKACDAFAAGLLDGLGWADLRLPADARRDR